MERQLLYGQQEGMEKRDREQEHLVICRTIRHDARSEKKRRGWERCGTSLFSRWMEKEIRVPLSDEILFLFFLSFSPSSISSLLYPSRMML